MKFSIKRTLSLLLVLVMLVGLLPIVALADDPTPGDTTTQTPDDPNEGTSDPADPGTTPTTPADTTPPTLTYRVHGGQVRVYSNEPLKSFGHFTDKGGGLEWRKSLAAGQNYTYIVEDLAGNTATLEIDRILPEIVVSHTCVGSTFTVTDASGIESVTINGKPVTEYKLPTEVGSVTIVATDNVGNTAELTINVQNHTWDEGVETKAPTCTEDGVTTFTCTACGETKTQAIPTTGSGEHTWNNGVITKQATCTTDGVKTYTCTVCGETKTEVIKATGKHTSSSWKVGRYPTEKRNGFMYKECTVCGTQLDTMVLTWRDVKPTLPFVDVDSKDSYFDAVYYVYDKGLMKGTSDTRFSPNRTFDRAMVAMILYRMEGRPSVKYNSVFPDVGKNDWYADCISWAYKNGVLKGYSDGTVRPDDPVTVEQLLTILYRYADSEGYNVTGRGSVNRYYDAEDISDYALKAVRWAVSEGLISGRGYLGPKSNATRAEVAEILTNFCKNVLKYK